MSFTIIRDTSHNIFIGGAATVRHEHDCDCCEFTGNFKDYDLYYCPDSDEKSLIARWGEGNRYCSTPLDHVVPYLKQDNHPIAAAYTAFKARD
jgi:hypothetical protein